VRFGQSLNRFLCRARGAVQLLPLSALAEGLSLLALRRAAEKGRLQARVEPAGWYSTQSWGISTQAHDGLGARRV